jgi:putative DNA primase/helicase
MSGNADPFTVGDLVQWTVQGQDKFPSPQSIRGFGEHDGQRFYFVHGSTTGLPADQVRKILPADACRLAAVAELDKGYWPTVLRAIGEIRPDGETSEGKDPFYSDWGLKRLTPGQISQYFAEDPCRGVGRCVGPGKAPGGAWLIDVEGDGPVAEDSRFRLFAGKVVQTLGHESARGRHEFYVADGPRLLKALTEAGAKPEKEPGVFKSVLTLPDLEFRIGGFKADGKTPLQVQCAIPPTIGADGQPRKSNGIKDMAPFPEEGYEYLEALAEHVQEREAIQHEHAIESNGNGHKLPVDPAWPGFVVAASAGPADRQLAYARKVLKEEGDKLAALAKGQRHLGALGVSMNLTGLVKAGIIGEAECRATFTESLRQAGLPDGEIKELIDSALAKATPRKNVPDFGSKTAKNGLASPAAKPSESDSGFVSFVSAPPEVRPISVALHPVPPMDARLLPEPLREWLEDIAERASCPLDLPAVSAMVCLGAVVGRRVAIRPKRFDDWTVVPNLWGMGVLPPGWLKTHCLEEPKKPLARLELEAREIHAQALNDFAVLEAVATAQMEAAKAALKDAAKGKKGVSAASEEGLKELAAQTLSKPDLTFPTLRRHIINDATVEKLGELLAENPQGLLLYRDELMGFLKTLEKQGHEGDRAFYLESWNGTGSYSYDRIGRGSLFIPSNTVSILGGIQPGKLAAYIRGAGSGENDDGLISRFQLMVYPDIDRPYRHVDRWPDAEAKNLAYDVFKMLASLDLETIGAKADKAGEIPYVRFTDDAQLFFDSWFKELENRVRSSQESACLTSHLAKYRSLLPSLALLFHLVEVVDGTASGQVSLVSVRRTAAWCDYLEQHARRIYQAAFDGDPEPAQRLAERIKGNNLPNPFTNRQVVKKGWKSLGTPDEVDRALGLLEDHNWVYPEEVQSTERGGRPNTVYHINPRLLQGDQA